MLLGLRGTAVAVILTFGFVCFRLLTHPDVAPGWDQSIRQVQWANWGARAGGQVVLTTPGASVSSGDGTIGVEGELPVRFPDLHPDKKHLVKASHGAVSCDVAECSDMGVDILKRGGNAVDASVTVALCIGSLRAFSSGIGGGGFMTVRHGNGTALSFDFREMAPGAAHKNMYDHDPLLAQVGGLAVAIPGELAGLEQSFNHFGSGKLSWAELIQPVIDINRNGFEVGTALSWVLQYDKEILMQYPEEWDQYYVDGRLAKLGETVKRLKLADTLETIANNGSARVFYDPEGPIAPALAAAAQARGGILTADDFARYEVRVATPLRGEFMGREVLVPHNPSSGPALLFALNVFENLEPWNETGIDYDETETQRLVEVMKFMAAQRSQLGDTSETQFFAKRMLTSEFAKEISANISDDTTHPWEFYKPAYEPPGAHGTTHFSIIDADNMAVGMTTTVNLDFGAKVADPKTGIVLNSEMDDFSLPGTSNWFGLVPSIYNFIAPYKRPLSSTVPTIISNLETGIPEMIVGAAGGSRITTAVLQAIVRTFRYRLPLLETIAYPRIHHQLLPHIVSLEPLSSPSLVQSLSDKGHEVEEGRVGTAMNAIVRHVDGAIEAVSDFWRSAGQAAGY